METLQDVLVQHHCYAVLFRTAHKWLACEPDDSPLIIHLLADPTHGQQHYNLPSVTEIAAVITGDGSQATDSHDIVLH